MVGEVLSFPEIFARMTLVNVLCRALEVKRESNGPADSARVDFSFGFGTQENQIVVQVKQDLSIFAAEQSPFVSLSGDFLVAYALPDAENILAGNEELESKITRYAHMAVHPYLRALTTDLANQVGVPGVTLGFLRLGAELPESLTVGEKLFTFNASDVKVEE